MRRNRLGPWLLVGLAACASAPPQPAITHPVVTGNAAELTRIVSGPEQRFWPRPSPDGTKLLLNVRDDSKIGNDRFSIDKVDVGKPGRTLVSQGDASSGNWYPDNSTFVYYTTRTGSARLVRSSVAGNAAGMTFLTPSPAGQYEMFPDVSTDGKRIVFQTSLDQPRYNGKGQRDPNQVLTPTIATINADGSSFTIYTTGEHPRFSPDGKKIAYDLASGRYHQIFIIDISFGGQVSQLTTGDYNNTLPSWSPDGQWLTYASDRDGGHRSIWAMKADGTSQTELTRGTSDDDEPAWSSDGYIYFSSKSAGNYEIWRIKPLLGVAP